MSRSGCVMPRATHRAITSAMPAPSAPANSSSHQCSSMANTWKPTPRIRYTSAIVIPTANTMTEPSFARIVGSRWRNVTSGSLVLAERVADPVHGSDEPGLGPILTELASDPRHVRVDDPAACVVAVSPDAVHQLLAREDHAGLAREREQDLELEGGERDLVPVHGHTVPVRVDREPVALERLGGRGHLECGHPPPPPHHPP